MKPKWDWYPKIYTRRWHSPIVGFAWSFTKSNSGYRAVHVVLNLIWVQLFLTVAQPKQ